MLIAATPVEPSTPGAVYPGHLRTTSDIIGAIAVEKIPRFIIEAGVFFLSAAYTCIPIISGSIFITFIPQEEKPTVKKNAATVPLFTLSIPPQQTI